MAAARRAVALDPRDPRYLKGLARAHAELDQSSLARDCLVGRWPSRRTLSTPTSRWRTCCCGTEYLPGWADYEWRLRSPLHRAWSSANAPAGLEWHELPGKRPRPAADQGYGDAFQFARYVSVAARRCAEVVLLRRPAQAPLFARLDGVGTCVTDIKEVGEHAAYAFLGSLLFVFGTEPAHYSPDTLHRTGPEAPPCLARSPGAVGSGPAGRPGMARQSGKYHRLAALDRVDRRWGCAGGGRALRFIANPGAGGRSRGDGRPRRRRPVRRTHGLRRHGRPCSPIWTCW